MSKYSNENLVAFCDEHGIRLMNDYSKERFHCDLRVECACTTCETPVSRILYQLIKTKTALCKKCSYTSRKQKTQETCLERYGQTNVMKNAEIRKKVEKTNLEKYGAIAPAQNKDVMARMRESCLERHGAPNPMQVESFREKHKASLEANYGVQNPTQSAEIYGRITKTVQERYGVDHVSQAEPIKKKITETVKNTYGVKHVSQIPEIKEQKIQTNLEKRGVEHPLQHPEIFARKNETMLERFGVAYPLQDPETMAIKNATCMDRYGVEYPQQLEAIQEKTRKTNLTLRGVEYTFQCENVKERYGERNAAHVPEFMEKQLHTALHQRKEYMLPSGNIIHVQGYEPLALETFFAEENLAEEDIVFARRDVPAVFWTDAEGKTHRHYVDFYIQSQNRMVEVKSTYLLDRDRDEIMRKKKAAEERGFAYEIYVYDGKKLIAKQ